MTDPSPTVDGPRVIPDADVGPVRHPPRIARFVVWLLLIVALGLAVRVGYILLEQHRSISGDGFGYRISVQDLLHGTGFVNPLTRQPSALHPPAWTLLLTGVTWLLSSDMLTQQLFAATLGAGGVAMIGLAARRVGGDRIGLIAAVIAAIYPGLWIYERALLSEVLLLPLVSLTILLAYRFRGRPTLAGAAVLGLMCGLLTQTRSEQILTAPLLVVPLVLAARAPGSGRRVPLATRLTWLVVAGAVTAAILAPWTIYNTARFHHPVLLTDNFGGTTGVANCDGAYGGPKLGYYDLRCIGNRGQAVSYATDHLDRLPVVLVAREGRAFGLWAPFQQTSYDAAWQHTSVGWNRLALFAYWALLVPAAAGVVVLRRRGVAVYPLLSFVAAVAITVAVTYGETRYRASAEPAIVILAAAGIDALVSRWRPTEAPGGPDVALDPEPVVDDRRWPGQPTPPLEFPVPVDSRSAADPV